MLVEVFSHVPWNVIEHQVIEQGVLFKTLQKSLGTSPSMSAISCNKIDRYMTRTSRRKGETFSSLRWLDYEAHKDSYDYQNAKKHCNRILLHAEPQIGKTGTYLCLIRDLRLDILGKKKDSLTATPAFDEGIFYQHKQCPVSEEIAVSETLETQNWQFPYWRSKTLQACTIDQWHRESTRSEGVFILTTWKKVL